jgi:hypothetical protein
VSASGAGPSSPRPQSFDLTGDDDDRDALPCLLGGEAIEDRLAVDPRQAQVEHDQVIACLA